MSEQLNPMVLLSLVHDLQSKILQLFDANTRYEAKIKELQEELEKLKNP